MKYLKKFNESVNINDVKNLCDSYLPYLYDDNYDINIDDSDVKIISISLFKKNTERDYVINDSDGNPIVLRGFKCFEWVDVKDQVIPFVNILYDKFNNLIITFNVKYGDIEEYSIDDILNDNISDDILLKAIEIGIEK